MKKLLSITLALIMLVAVALTAIPAGAEEIAPTGTDNTLTVTVNGTTTANVKVGNEFIVRVGLNAGAVKIMNGQAQLLYDASHIAFDPHTVDDPTFDPEDADEGEVPDNDVIYYCYPSSIVNANIVMNYGVPNTISYNFTRATGVAVFNNTDKLFARFRFKATAPGTTDISHVIQYMINVDEQQIYYKDQPNAEINPVMAVTIEESEGCIGDIDGDGEISILDATYMQRVTAGVDLSYDVEMSDVTGDKMVSLKDVVITRRYLAGRVVDSPIGNWVFASEA